MSDITITVLHNIFLTREERYKLAEGVEIKTVGVSVPVWFHQGRTTEPASEVFCQYRISNALEQTPITNYEEGYTINLPQKSEMAVAIKHPMTKPQEGQYSPPPTSEMLKDIKDGGCAHMQFKQYAKVRKDGKVYNLLHFCELKPIETLLDTLSYN